ncbi:MAG TPA: hypothetical protein VFV23_08255 [Verrucomicrobiae bacterium]|nr:hypothetical protein [Verrucomicrobiae bacterium]
MKNKILRIFGFGFILIAAAIAFFWFVWLIPLKHIYSRDWNENHSTYRYWIEAQKTVGRVGVTHDVGIEIGKWGDEKWVARIITKLKPNQEIGGCENSHLGEALEDLTNQGLGTKSDAWIAWWKTNQNKTQLEWIRDGFEKQGIQLQKPLTTNNIIALLKLINPSPWSVFSTNQFSHTLRYNAMRWLRDSGFRAQQFDLSLIPEKDRDQIIFALLEYAQWYGEHYFDPGHLPIDGEFSYSYPEPIFLSKELRWKVYLAIIFVGLFGFILIHFSKCGRKSEMVK